ncbi:MAG: hypothetical protein JSR76_03815 [Verrucomicrobia bacterium]|nr:hypothetical protein [Verrucomicrobiota bacterium]
MRKRAFILTAMILLTACSYKKQGDEIATIHLIDKNGFQETISSPDRISQLQKNDFLQPQPYEKVTRVYRKNSEGKNESRLTTYHPNGGVYQYLETVGGRANGVYKEWYENGNLRMVAVVIEGIGDITPEAQATFVFDSKNFVYDEEGRLLAEITYNKGELEGPSRYYYPNGTLAKIIPYQQDKIEGTLRLFSKEGNPLGETNYHLGVKEGRAFFAGSKESPRKEEEFKNGKLLSATYWDGSEDIVQTISQGYGVKPSFEKGILRLEEEIRNGSVEGTIKVYRDNGSVESLYHIHDGQKEGEEWCYYDKVKGEEPQPMLYIQWQDDEIHGTVRTWYPSGVLESEKEVSHNKKQGMALSWYTDGSLMLVEEYESDKLQQGKYFKRGETSPTSRIIDGSGRASLFDGDGNFLRKITYQKGIPTEE